MHTGVGVHACHAVPARWGSQRDLRPSGMRVATVAEASASGLFRHPAALQERGSAPDRRRVPTPGPQECPLMDPAGRTIAAEHRRRIGRTTGRAPRS
jgi:hypothetical protein